MILLKQKVLTGLVTFSVAAAAMGMPAMAIGLPQDGAPQNVISQNGISLNGISQSGITQNEESSAVGDPADGGMITLENAKERLIADSVLAVVGPGERGADKEERKAVINSAPDKNRLQQEEKLKLAVAAPNVYLNIHTDASLGSEVVGKLYSNDVAKILQDNGGDWVKIKSGKLVGYVLGEYLVRGDEAQLLSELVKKNVAVVDQNEEEVEVHRNKSRYGVMMTVLPGQQIDVEEDMEQETDGWIEVSTENGRGYVRIEDINIIPSRKASTNSRSASRTRRSRISPTTLRRRQIRPPRSLRPPLRLQRRLQASSKTRTRSLRRLMKRLP